jgi:hypothetical protein
MLATMVDCLSTELLIVKHYCPWKMVNNTECVIYWSLLLVYVWEWYYGRGIRVGDVGEVNKEAVSQNWMLVEATGGSCREQAIKLVLAYSIGRTRLGSKPKTVNTKLYPMRLTTFNR